MTETVTRKRKRLRDEAGPHAITRVYVNDDGVVRAVVICRLCQSTPDGQRKRWQNPADPTAKGPGSSVMKALGDWEDHLDDQHPDQADDDWPPNEGNN